MCADSFRLDGVCLDWDRVCVDLCIGVGAPEHGDAPSSCVDLCRGGGGGGWHKGLVVVQGGGGDPSKFPFQSVHA